MSAEEVDASDATWAEGSETKKRRIQRACDTCRRKKIRCDGGQMPRNRCSNCIAYRLDCTYVEAAKKRGPPKGYVEGLENRVEKLEKLLTRLCPDIDLAKELENFDLDSSNRWQETKPPTTPSGIVSSSVAADMAAKVIRAPGSSPTEDDYNSDDDDGIQEKLTERIKQLAIDPVQHRFFGKSSGVTLIQTAMDLKKELTGTDYDDKATFLKARRPDFWNVRPWERSSGKPVSSPTYIYPEKDLIACLTDLYFSEVNVFLPLLHRPTFEKAVADELHLRDTDFGSTLLLVCAVASQYSDDPRIFLDGTDSEHSCGWKWFEQVQVVKKSLLSPPTLHDLQFFSLSVVFLEKSSAPQACWTMVGIGIRLAQDVGAHRRKVYNRKLTVEDELWKRSFWCLVCMDRLVSTGLGRPCAIQDEDFDLELPIECDDEYWEHPDPEKAFKQPPGKPSVIAYFNCYLKLNQVLAFTLRTIYSINKSKILLGFVGQQWEQHIVAELDSALNKWIDSVPDHLRWDPNRENNLFFSQSVALYASYYHLQILIHRPFIPSPRNPSPLSFPSLAICTNAARTCSHVVDIHRRRGLNSLSHVQLSVFSAAIVLLLNIWEGKRAGISTDAKKEMEDVHKCMEVLKRAEQRSHSAGRLRDILLELAYIGDLPLPQTSPSQVHKRERDSDEPIAAALVSSGLPSSTDVPRTIAGSRRVSSAKDMSPLDTKQGHQNIYPAFSLPMHSDELGRVPPHSHVEFSSAEPQQSHPESAGSTSHWYHSDPISAHTHGDGSSMSISGAETADVTLPEMFPMDTMFYDPVDYTTRLFGGSEPGSSTATDSSNPSPDHFQQASFLDAAQAQRMHVHSMAVRSAPIVPTHSGVDDGRPGNVVDYGTMTMWTQAPTGFELDDWGTYISNVSELTQLHGVDNEEGQ